MSSNPFNPGVDDVNEDRILFYHPNSKRLRRIDDEKLDVDLLLKKLLSIAKSSLLTQLQGYFDHVLEYFKLSGKVVAFVIAAIIGIFVLEIFLKYFFSKFYIRLQQMS